MKKNQCCADSWTSRHRDVHKAHTQHPCCELNFLAENALVTHSVSLDAIASFCHGDDDCFYYFQK